MNQGTIVAIVCGVVLAIEVSLIFAAISVIKTMHQNKVINTCSSTKQIEIEDRTLDMMIENEQN